MAGSNRSVDDYLAALSEGERAALERLRSTIREVVPDATEVISYQVPTFRYRGRQLVGFGVTKSHLTFFVMSTTVMAAFKNDLKGYEVGKGSIKFQVSKPIPSLLIRRIVKARIAENEELAKGR